MTTAPRSSPRLPPEGQPIGRARWLDVLTTTVLGASVLIVAVAAAPSLLRAGESAASGPQEFSPPVRRPHPTLVPRDHPPAFAIDDEPEEEPTRGAPGPRSRGARPAEPPSPRSTSDADDADDGPGLGLGLKSGVTMRPLLLRDRMTGSVVHEIRPGEPVSILREDGDWVLVVRQTHDDLVTGWARRSELLLR